MPAPDQEGAGRLLRMLTLQQRHVLTDDNHRHERSNCKIPSRHEGDFTFISLPSTNAVLHSSVSFLNRTNSLSNKLGYVNLSFFLNCHLSNCFTH